MPLSDVNEYQGPFGCYIRDTCRLCQTIAATLQIEIQTGPDQAVLDQYCAPCLRRMADSIDTMDLPSEVAACRSTDAKSSIKIDEVSKLLYKIDCWLDGLSSRVRGEPVLRILAVDPPMMGRVTYHRHRKEYVRNCIVKDVLDHCNDILKVTDGDSLPLAIAFQILAPDGSTFEFEMILTHGGTP